MFRIFVLYRNKPAIRPMQVAVRMWIRNPAAITDPIG
jgi:hypothetical protein